MVDFAKHLKKIRQQAAPSLHPAPAREKKAPELVPDLRELVPDAEERTVIARLTAKYLAFGQQEREAKKAKEAIGAELKPKCNDYALMKAMVGELRLSYYLIKRSTIQADLLRQRGVSQSVINACTVKSESWALRVTAPGISEEEE